MTFRIGTRGSKLATTQAGHMRDALKAQGIDAELTIITTPGDVNMSPVERIGVGVFTQALRDAMMNDECDIAVHSFKDLPTAPDTRFHLVVPERADCREAFITKEGKNLQNLPEGARIGTSAPRRISQLRGLRADLNIQPLRGNIDTRMGKVDSGELDAVVLAAAGLQRVNMLDRASVLFDANVFLPAPAQGALAIECRADNQAAVDAINTLRHEDSELEATAERIVLNRLEAGCTAPVASHATITGGHMHLVAGVFALDGTKNLRFEVEGPKAEAIQLGEKIAQQLLEAGAAEIMAADNSTGM